MFVGRYIGGLFTLVSVNLLIIRSSHMIVTQLMINTVDQRVGIVTS